MATCQEDWHVRLSWGRNQGRGSLASRRINWQSQIYSKRMERMKVKYIKNTVAMCLTKNNIYEVLSIEKGWYRIVDDTGEDYLYPPDNFEIIEDKIAGR